MFRVGPLSISSLVLLLASCLSSPKPADFDGGTNDGGVLDGNDGDGTPFPGSRSVNIRHVRTTDIDRDQEPEFYVVSDTQEPEDRGVFIFRAPQVGSAPLRYDRFINTVAVPHDVAFYDLVGGPEVDLILIGKQDASLDHHVEIYEQDSNGDFAKVGQRIVDGFRPDPMLPIMIEVGALDGALLNDVIVGSLSSLSVFFVDDVVPDLVDGLSGTTATTLGRDGSANTIAYDNGINGIVARNLTPGVDSILVIENNTLTWLRNDGAGSFTAEPSADNSSTFPIRTFVEIDLDGTPPADLFGGGLFDIGTWSIATSGPTVSFEDAAWTNEDIAFEINALGAGNLDGNANTNDVVAFVPNQTSGGELYIYPNIVRSGTTMTPVTPVRHAMSLAPEQGIVFNIDGEGPDEILVFDRETGDYECVTIASGTPGSCP